MPDTAFGLLTSVPRLHVPQVGPEAKEEKERAEEILAFGNPGDGFDMQGVPGEQGGNKGAAPESSGHATEQQE